jgi:hypothetical protein
VCAYSRDRTRHINGDHFRHKVGPRHAALRLDRNRHRHTDLAWHAYFNVIRHRRAYFERHRHTHWDVNQDLIGTVNCDCARILTLISLAFLYGVGLRDTHFIWDHHRHRHPHLNGDRHSDWHGHRYTHLRLVGDWNSDGDIDHTVKRIGVSLPIGDLLVTDEHAARNKIVTTVVLREAIFVAKTCRWLVYVLPATPKIRTATVTGLLRLRGWL